MSLVIGIDLGTSTTEAAVYRDGRPVMLPNPDGEFVTPSVVGVDGSGNWLVGEEARERLLLEPALTAAEVKRKIGSGEKITLGGVGYTPVALSAKLLAYVKAYASAALGEEVSRAVISVPAYFDERQRQETLQAGEKAGFTVERILNEPTAAALSYGLNHMAEESHILVYDLGGGTFDVTLLEMFDGVLEVKASAGDNHLGGKDFDEALMDTLITRFHKKNDVNLRKDAFAMAHLKAEAEHCKRALSREEKVTAIIPAIAKKGKTPLALEEEITRADFEKMTRKLLERTHAPIERVLQDSGITKEQIDRIILVGGSTRMPMVAADIRAFLGLEVTEAVNPDFAVAEGAAIEAALLSGEIDPEEGLMMTDVNPYSLGIRAIDDEWNVNHMQVIIPRNVTIPVTRSQRFWTVTDRQTEAEIEVFQGESGDVRKNHDLGNFMLSGIPPRAAQKEGIDVFFTYNTNGMLVVRGVIVSTGKEATLSINLQAGAEPAEEEVNLDSWKEHPLAPRCRPVIRMTERWLRGQQDGDTAAEVQQCLDALKRAIIEENHDLVAEQEARLMQLMREGES